MDEIELDLKDRKLLYHLDQNSRQPLSELARKVGLSKEVVYYRINNLVKKGIIKKFYTIIDISKLGFVQYKNYVQFQNLTKEKEEEILTYLTKKSQVFWVATNSGRWDLMIGSFARNTIDFNDNILEPFLDKYSEFILNKETTTTKHNIQQNRRWVYEKGDKIISSVVGGEPNDLKLDKTDVAILEILENNARMPVTEIARKIKTTATIVNYRIKKLLKQGVIQSFRIALDLEKLNYEFCKAFIYLKNINKEKLKRLINYCKENKNILNIVTLVGSWDVEIEFEVENFGKFHGLMKEIREVFADIIKNYESVIISKEPRVDFMPETY